jgi:hypothetical protein
LQVVEAVDARLARLQQGREGGDLAAPLDQDRARLGPERVDRVVVAEDPARLAVERFDALVLVPADA